MKVALVYNPSAGDREYSREKLSKTLRRHGHRVAPVAIEGLIRSRRMPPNVDVVVVAGGDGSVKRVARALAGSGRPIAILPTGTANNIALGLGISGSIDRIVGGWKRGTIRPLDLGVAAGPWGRRYFIESVGVGLIGRAVALMSDIRRLTSHRPPGREDRLHVDRCVMLAIARELEPVQLRVAADGRAPKAGRFLLCEILNIQRGGPRIELSRVADPTDGRLDLVTVAARERPKLVALLERNLSGRGPGRPLRSDPVTSVRLSLRRCELRIDDELAWPPVEARDDPRRRTTVQVEIAPGALQCLTGTQTGVPGAP